MKVYLSYISVILFLLFYFNVNAQKNLVPNYSFEYYTSCPAIQNGATISLAYPWINLVNSDAQYSNSCCNNNLFGVPFNRLGWNYQFARTGKAYAGMFFINNYNGERDYIQTKLIGSLKSNHCYYIEFFVNNANSYFNACNNISLLIGDTAIKSVANAKFTLANPQIQQSGNPIISDTLNWIKVAGIYTAHGGEQFITIGNFKDNIHTDTIIWEGASPISTGGAGYNIDDVSVIDLLDTAINAYAGRDTTIKQGDSVWIGSRLCGLTTQWFDVQGNNIANDIPGMWVKPTASTYYVLQQNACGQLSSDTVWVTVAALPVTIKNYELKINNGIHEYSVLNQWETTNEVNVLKYNIQSSGDGKNFETVGYVIAKGNGSYSFIAPAPNGGIGYYRLEVVDKDGKKMYSEVRSVELRINNEELRINPNPAKDFVTISGSNIKEISIVDLYGRTVISKAMNSNTINIAINNLSKGIYLVKAIRTDKGIKTEKLVVE